MMNYDLQKNKLIEILNKTLEKMTLEDFKNLYEENEDLLFLAVLNKIQKEDPTLLKIISYRDYNSYILNEDTNVYVGLFKVSYKDINFGIFASNKISEDGYSKPIIENIHYKMNFNCMN